MNLPIGLHDEPGVLRLLVGGEDISGQSTFSQSVGASLRAVGNVLTPIEVPFAPSPVCWMSTHQRRSTS